MRKGGHAHPIRPRDYSYHLPRKIRALGMRMALSSKLYMNNLRVVESLNEAGWTATYQAARALTSGKRIAAEYAEQFGYNGDVEREEKRAARATKALPPYKRAALRRQHPVEEEGLFEEEQAAEEEEAALRAKDAEASAAGEDAVASSEVLEEDTAAESEEKPQLSLEDITVKSQGFGGPKDLSILFLYPPTKSAREIWDFARVVRNIPGVEIMSTDDVEVYHILKFKWLVLEGGAVDSIATHAGQVAPELPDLGAGIENTSTDIALPAEDNVVDDPDATRIPRMWVLDKWRKPRGSKSLIKTFGLRNANIQKLLAKRAWNKIRKEGRTATPDGVAAEVAKRKVGGVKALGRVQPQIGGSAGF